MKSKIDELMALADVYAASFGDPRNDVVERKALRAALEAALKPGEPVYWEYKHVDDGEDDWQKLIPRIGQTLETALKEIQGYRSDLRQGPMYEVRQLYTAPPAQTPPRLTDEEINHFIKFPSAGSAMRRDGTTSQRIARAVETAVRKQFGVNDE